MDNFHDFDLLVSPGSFKDVINILETIGARKGYDKDPSRENHFCSMGFVEYTVDGIDIDVICEFGFNLFGTKFIYHFNDDEVHRVKCGNLLIPITESEVQLVFYALMVPWQPQRAFKRDLIEEFLLTRGIQDREVLERAFALKDLPDEIKAQIGALIH